jgi:hypothetical protein
MIDKAFSFFLFFIFLFFILFQLKGVLLNKFGEEIAKENYVKIQKVFVNKRNCSIYNCQKVVERNIIEVIKIDNDNVNPKINGYSLITEPIICELTLPPNNTTINYSFS